MRVSSPMVSKMAMANLLSSMDSNIMDSTTMALEMAEARLLTRMGRLHMKESSRKTCQMGRDMPLNRVK